MHGSWPGDPDGQSDLLLDRARGSFQLCPEVIKVPEPVKRGPIGQLASVNHMSSKVTGGMENPETLFSQSLASIAVSGPSEALASVQSDLEHVGELVDCLASSLHVFRRLHDDGPVVDVRNRTVHQPRRPHPFVE